MKKQTYMNTLIVTRHPALIDYLISDGLATADTPTVSHVTPDDVRGKHVIGVLPMHLASLAESITEIPLDIPADMRGKELSLADMRNYARRAVTYVVNAA
tara:strand:+ start:210 stop:509 length:300 start_codon:yes stop_codon:yes gene_type:complete